MGNGKTAWAGLGVSLLSVVAAAGQSPKLALVHGVVQTENGESVEGARVEIRDLGLSAVSRTDGTFRFESLRPGRYWITVSRSGLDPQRKAVTLEGNEDRLIDFHLSPVSPALSEKRTLEMDSLSRALAERLKSSLDGIFLTRDDIARSRQPQLGAVLANYLIQTAPRSAVRSGANCAPFDSWVSQQARANSRFLSDPQAYPFISVNGGRPFRGRALYEFDPTEVEALEFYRGAGPAFGYIPSSAQCGLVIVWTK
jgi:hypothetical protein